MYTSGTTGRPKGVVISHGNALQNSVTCTTVIGRRPDDIELVMVPQFNITGLCSQTVPAMLLGMTAVLLDGFDAARALDAIGAARRDVDGRRADHVVAVAGEGRGRRDRSELDRASAWRCSEALRCRPR